MKVSIYIIIYVINSSKELISTISVHFLLFTFVFINYSIRYDISRSLDLWISRIGGWRGHTKSQFLNPPFRKSNLSMFICLLWRITTCLSAITISVLLTIGGVEINPGPGSTSDEEISPMEIDCMDDTFDSFETLQHTPISSQVLPMPILDLSSQCSSDASMTPEKSFSAPKSRKRKGYRARKDRNRVDIKIRRIDDEVSHR